jgi:hypothetical protein
MRAKFLAGVGLVGLMAALWLAPAASAETATIGAAAPSPLVLFGGAPHFTVIQQTTDPASPSYVVPQVPAGAAPWSITSWGALGGAGDGSASVEVWRPTSTSGEFRLITIGPEQAFPTHALTSHAVNIPVLPGDHLGVRSGPDSDFSPSYGGQPPGDAAIWPTGASDPVVGQTIGAASSDFSPHGGSADARANVKATLTSAPAAAPSPTPQTAPSPTPQNKCKKKKHKKRSAASAKKKGCKKKHKK